MRRKGRKAARFGKQCARWLRPAAIALLLLFAWSLGQSNVFERLAPAPSPQPSTSALEPTPTPHAPRAGKAGYARLDFALWRALSRHVQL